MCDHSAKHAHHHSEIWSKIGKKGCIVVCLLDIAQGHEYSLSLAMFLDSPLLWTEFDYALFRLQSASNFAVICHPLMGEFYTVNAMQAEREGNGSSPACRFPESSSSSVQGSVAEHEFDLDW